MAGFTGVNWQPRGAKRLALDLTTGAGPSAVVDTATAWQEITDIFTDAHDTSTKLHDQLMEAYKGRYAEDTLDKLQPFTDWLDQMSGVTQQVSDTANTYAESYGTAVIDMPHINDLAVLEHAKVAAMSAGGPLLGLSATTEGMDQDLNLQATKAMQAYEVASEPAAKPFDFPAAPEIIKNPDDDKKKEGHGGGGGGTHAAGMGGVPQGPRALNPDSLPGGGTAAARATATALSSTSSPSTGGMGMSGMGGMGGMMAAGGLAAAAGASRGIKANDGKKSEEEDDESLANISATGVFVGNNAVDDLTDLTARPLSGKVSDFEYVDATAQLEPGGSKGSVAPPVLGASADL